MMSVSPTARSAHFRNLVPARCSGSSVKLALVALILASPAAAGEIRFEETDEGVLLHYHNELTMGDVPSEETFTFESSRGPIAFVLRRTQNNSCNPIPCADVLEVVDLPPGTVAIPAEVELPELADTTVKIIEFNGI